jgi:hypothetical protein
MPSSATISIDLAAGISGPMYKIASAAPNNSYHASAASFLVMIKKSRTSLVQVRGCNLGTSELKISSAATRNCFACSHDSRAWCISSSSCLVTPLCLPRRHGFKPAWWPSSVVASPACVCLVVMDPNLPRGLHQL